MPRVYQALSRSQAALNERQAATGREDAGAPETVHHGFPTEPGTDSDVTKGGSVRQSVDTVGGLAAGATQAQVDVASIVARSLTVGTGLCPNCDAYSDSRLPPAYLRWSYRLTRTPMHLCRACGHRYHTPKSPRTKQGPPMPAFLPPSSGRTFQDLVRDMARDERDWHHSEELTRSR